MNEGHPIHIPLTVYLPLRAVVAGPAAVTAAKTGGQPRVFDFSKYQQRSVVLQLMYVGWSYQGFARQADSDNTIEVGGSQAVSAAWGKGWVGGRQGRQHYSWGG